MKAKFVPTDWESIVASLQRKEFDVIIDGISRISPVNSRPKAVKALVLIESIPISSSKNTRYDLRAFTSVLQKKRST
jgi:hypothetical protein